MSRFISRLLRPDEQPRPFTPAELAGYRLKPEDQGRVALVGLNDPRLTTIGKQIGSMPINEFRKLVKEIQGNVVHPFITLPSIADAVYGVDRSTNTDQVEKWHIDTTEIPKVDDLGRQLLISMYCCLQYAEAFLRLHNDDGSPMAEWEQWRQTGLNQFTPLDLVVALSILIFERQDLFNGMGFSSDADIVPKDGQTPLQYMFLDITNRVTRPYNVSPVEVVYAFGCHPEYELGKEFISEWFKPGFLETFRWKTLDQLFPDVFDAM